MKFLFHVLGLFLISLHVCGTAAAEFPLAYVGSPDIMDISLSPTTQEVAVLTKKYKYKGGARTWDGIDIIDFTTGDIRVTHQEADHAYYWVNWVSDDMIVAYARKLYFKKRKVRGQNVLLAINPKTGTYRELFATKKVKKSEKLGHLKLVSFSGKLNQVVFALFEHKSTTLVAVNLDTGKATVLDKGTEDTLTWFVDDDHVPYMRLDTSGYDHVRHYKQQDANGNWTKFRTVNMLETPFDVVRFQRDSFGFRF